ncbi:TNF receptor-associated factor family DDB_G0272829-like [Paramuricea clavata]|uniref:TNF receptor-associated factor family DDB_G0272829-like n=1 Tax=Paramuricea clavata TaxID=317549 RepID=A0A6S7FEN2_PARCT|nr:TNF receptor-associated factor family DDB_G0272829-like [Paramuricea clavata]
MAKHKYNDDLNSSFMDNFSCKICLEVLHDPVQCQNNEHYFCRKCVTKHLGNSETCPLCMEQLTLETLRTVPRVILDIVAQLKKPRCSHVSRGCEENVQVEVFEELLLHEQTCGYAPVVCSNEGCKETVNRRDKESHETEECKFRMITCESCDEELVYVDYEKHQCTLRKEINEMKSRLDEMNDTLKRMAATQDEFIEKFKAYDKSIKDLQDPLRCASSATMQQHNAIVVNGQIFIFGGHDDKTGKSLEVFNWSTKTWTLIKNCLFVKRHCAYTFLYERKIMICGGVATDRIEYLNPREDEYTSSVFSCSTPRAQHCGALCGNRVIAFYDNIREVSLESDEEPKDLVGESGYRSRYAGVHCFGKIIYVVGGNESKMEKYDVDKNELKTLSSLPYKVSNMATVPYKDNIIILGGQDGKKDGKSLNDVVIFNVTTHDYKKLPSMLEKRSGCTAVIMGKVVVVMGGLSTDAKGKSIALNTVEYHVIGQKIWQKLPAMHLAREGATACVHV